MNIRKNEIIDLLAFKLRIAECLIKGSVSNADESEEMEDQDEYLSPPLKKSQGEATQSSNTPREHRKFKALHLPEAVEASSAPRCRNPGCKHRSRVACISCKAFLCLSKERNCFKEFHS